ncbi:hypothetical protein DAI22_07g226500 [Oryza sativa Japonica Group]|nr:hypothetical protein DAI22_07g226500 [Oryza sativa Japonica Group]
MVKGALALTSSLAGLLLGFLYFKQDRDDSAWEYTRKEEETVKWRDVIEPSVRAKFTRKDGTFAYPEYYGYLRVQMNGGKPNYDQKCSDKEEAIVDDDAADTDEDDNNAVDEPAMKAKFEDWMKEHGRIYITKKEKAHRYENFKKAMKGINELNIKRGMRSPLAAPTELADYTDEEVERLGITMADDSDWDEYLDHIHTAIARGYVFRVDDEDVCEAVKKERRELLAMHDNATHQTNSSCRQTAASQKERAHVINFDFLVDLVSLGQLNLLVAMFHGRYTKSKLSPGHDNVLFHGILNLSYHLVMIMCYFILCYDQAEVNGLSHV